MQQQTHLHNPANNVIILGAKAVELTATKAHASASLNLASLTRAAAELAALRERLMVLAGPIVEQLHQLRAQFARDAKPILAQVEMCESEIKLLLQTYPTCLGKRKTMEAAGIKFGFRKAPDRLEIGEGAVDLILERVDAERYLRTEVHPNKEALESMSDDQLQQVDYQRITGKDQAFVAADKALDTRLKMLDS